MLKRVDVAVYDYINASAAGDRSTLPKVFDLKVDGVGYATTGDHSTDIARSSTPTRRRSSAVKITVPEHAVAAGRGPKGAPGEAWRSRQTADGDGYAVELVGITKRFPGVVANDDITPAGAPRRGARARAGRTAPASRR